MLEAIFGGLKNLTLAQECARAVLIFFYGLLMLRLSGKRTFAHMSALDLIISVIVGSALSRAMMGEVPLGGTLAAVAVVVALHLVLAHGVARSRSFSRWVEGCPVVLATDGVVDEKARLGCKISIADLDEALRGKGVDGIGAIGEVKKLVLEPSGNISVLRKSG